MIFLNTISKSYDDKKIIDGLSYRFEDHGFYVIKGPSGCGKTTLLKMMLGLTNVDEGKIYYDDNEVTRLSDFDFSNFRFNNIGYVCQNRSALSFKSVDETLRLKDLFSKDKVVLRNVLKLIGLNNPKQKVTTLSGGELRRLQLGQAIVSNPKILLCDEVTNGLDEENIIKVLKILEVISRNVLVILVSHDEIEKYLPNVSVLNLEKGKIVEKCIKGEITKNLQFKNDNNKKPFGLFRYNLRTLFNKKIRALIMLGFTIIPLTISGYILNLVSNIKDIISSSTSTLFKTNTFVASSRSDNTPYYSSMEYEDISSRLRDYDYEYINYIYECSFNEVFKDENACYINSKKINGMNISSFNEFEFDSTIPVNQIKLELNFHTYNDLFSKITSFDELELSLKNEDYGYNESLFYKINSIVMGDKNKIYSSDLYFNKSLFEDTLKFPITTSVGESLESINTLRRYINVKFSSLKDAYSFEDNLGKSIIVNHYKSSLLEFSYFYSNNEYIVNKEMKKANLPYLIGSPRGYLINEETGYSGFSGYLYISNQSNVIDNLITTLDGQTEIAHLGVNSNEQFLKGNILNTSINNINLGYSDDLLELEQINISSILSDYFNLKIGDPLFYTYFINGRFLTGYLEIVNVVRSNDFTLFQNPSWFKRLLRDKYQIDEFSNLSTCGLFQLEEEYQDYIYLNTCKKLIYELSNNLYLQVNEVYSSLNTIVIVTIILMSLIVLINSMLGIIINKSIEEDSLKEINQLRTIGLSLKEIALSDFIRKSLLLIISAVESIVCIYLCCYFSSSKINVFGSYLTNGLLPSTWLFILLYVLINEILFCVFYIIKTKKAKTLYYL